MKSKAQILTIIALSCLTRFLFFGQPNETVSDEVHFGKFISGYFSEEYFFDVHPPLGKLLISAMGYLGGFQPGFAFAKIGEPFPDRTYLWLRFLPALAGVLLPVVIYYLTIQLGISATGAFAASLVTLFDNSLVVQSRFILLDSLLVLFGFASLLFYLQFRSRKKLGYLLTGGAMAGLAVSVKWTGLSFLALILGWEAVSWVRSRPLRRLPLLQAVGCLILLPLAIYCSVIVIHLSLLSKCGPGDAFMTPAFQKTLEGSTFADDEKIMPLSLIAKVQEINAQMYKVNVTLTAGHPYGSKWYSWPFMVRPIYYWVKSADSKPAQQPASRRIYYIGNPLTWWASTAAMLYLAITLLLTLTAQSRAKWSYLDSTGLLLLAAYFLNLLPFIGINRVMFLYHYMTALVFAYIGMVYLVDKIQYVPLFTQVTPTLPAQSSRDQQGFLTLNSNRLYVMIIVFSVAGFLFFSPLTYGLLLTESGYNLRLWLPTWK